MRVVLDTNVLLATFATRGLCEALMGVCLESCHIVLSEYILSELRQCLLKKLKVPRKQVEAIVSFLCEHAETVEPLEVAPNARRDENDLPVLGTALAGQAECLVTGDKYLLVISHFQNIPILSPRAFYDHLQQ